MATIRRLNLADLIAFVLIVAAAAGARVWYLNTAADSAATGGPLRMQDAQAVAPPEAGKEIRGRTAGTELDVLADNLKRENKLIGRPPFSASPEETAHIAPGYPYFLSLLDRFSSDADKADQLTRWVQAGLGAITAGLYYLIAVLAFRSRLVGVLAGLFAVLHPFWIVSAAAIDDGALATFLLALVLFLGTRGSVSGGVLTSLLYGLSLAALALVRAALLPFSVVGLIWFLIRCRLVPAGWMCGLLSLLGFIIGLAPWSVRNWQSFHEPMPIVNSTFVDVWMGNNPRATGGPMTEDEMKNALVRGPEDKDGLALQQRLGEATSQKDRYRVLGEATLKAVRDDPAGTVRRRIWAGLSFFFGEKFLSHPDVWVENELMASPGKYEPLPDWLGENLPVIFYGSALGMLLLGVLGWRWTYGWRHSGRLLALATIFIPLPYILTHAEALVGPRLPLDGVFLTFAAFALACLIPGAGVPLFRGSEGPDDEEPILRRLQEDKPHVRI
jgi:hypothetical protein